MKPLTKKLLDWYRTNARKLPWRNHPDAYAVWVSEIMLQQTRVETVIPYFERWMHRFPTIPHLAKATEQEVLKSWEGLGYYGRARNLYKAAILVMDEHAGEIPKNPTTLQNLPGIGRYTTSAILSMAFGLDTATLDGNSKRIFSRLFDMEEPVDLPVGEKRLWDLAEEYMPRGRAGEYNQAFMDLGAMICLPKNPRCMMCPLMEYCQARAKGTQDLRPVKKPRKQVPHYIVTAAVIRQEGCFLMAKRPADGLLGGLWEFPGGKVEPGESLEDGLRREIREELGINVQVREPCGIYKHAYTHFKITLHAFFCSADGNDPRPIEAEKIHWVAPIEMGGYPMGKVDRLIARMLVELYG